MERDPHPLLASVARVGVREYSRPVTSSASGPRVLWVVDALCATVSHPLNPGIDFIILRPRRVPPSRPGDGSSILAKFCLSFWASG